VCFTDLRLAIFEILGCFPLASCSHIHLILPPLTRHAQDGGAGELGTVTAVRGWGSADAKDAVLVAWDKQSDGRTFVYRFGVLAANGARRVYDVVRADERAVSELDRLPSNELVVCAASEPPTS